MEGQPEAEPGAAEQLQCQREPGEEEWKHWQGGQVRNTLHLVSAVAQWILLLVCLIYLGMDFLRPSETQSDKVPWTHIQYSGKIIKEVAVNLTAVQGPMQIRSGSILIPCDGLYLVSLQSIIYLEEEEDWLNLTLQKTHKTTSSALWEQIVQSTESTVNLITVLFLFEQESIMLWTNSSATIFNLSLSMVLLSDNCQLEELKSSMESPAFPSHLNLD